MESAGGIGGLLGCLDTQGTGTTADDAAYAFFYDANGNVGQLADLSADPNDPAGALAAAYEYDAYGNVIATTGDSADDNPFRFSTKYWDDETGLGYWGERYYEPRLGRWINHDPIGELGGLNLYSYALNQATHAFDATGRLSVGPDVYSSDQPDCNSHSRPNNPGAPVNGCSSPFGDSPSGVSFTRACNAHDRCYGTCGRSKEKCDAEFLEDMLAACDAASLDALSVGYCRFWARTYHGAVKRHGDSYYVAAQAHCLAPLPPPPPPIPSPHPCADIAGDEFFDCMLATNGDERSCDEAAEVVYDSCCRDAGRGGLPCPQARSRPF